MRCRHAAARSLRRLETASVGLGVDVAEAGQVPVEEIDRGLRRTRRGWWGDEAEMTTQRTVRDPHADPDLVPGAAPQPVLMFDDSTYSKPPS
jgi:hypothetical protein